MMKDEAKLSALLQLLDDPDDEVYETVSENLLRYGPEAITRLEALWEKSQDSMLQGRIETLIHRVHFSDLQALFYEWSRMPNPGLLQGAMLVARYQYPGLNAASLMNEFHQIRRNVWLELNSFLNPLDQANVFHSILYSYYRIQGHELSTRDPKYFFINNTLESRQGNAYTIGVLYLALAELLDVPIFAVDIPRQFVLAYIEARYPRDADHPQHHVQFFIDPQGGAIYTITDVAKYLHKINAAEPYTQLFAPLDNKRIIYKMLEELALCYRYNGDELRAAEIETLMRILV